MRAAVAAMVMRAVAARNWRRRLWRPRVALSARNSSKMEATTRREAAARNASLSRRPRRGPSSTRGRAHAAFLVKLEKGEVFVHFADGVGGFVVVGVVFDEVAFDGAGVVGVRLAARSLPSCSAMYSLVAFTMAS